MQNSTLFRRAAALLLTAALALTLVLPGLAAYEMPIQTVNEGESVYLFNADADDICETSYKDRGGKYQGQTGVTLPRT
jgi:hypothetical protein